MINKQKSTDPLSSSGILWAGSLNFLYQNTGIHIWLLNIKDGKKSLNYVYGGFTTVCLQGLATQWV